VKANKVQVLYVLGQRVTVEYVSGSFVTEGEQIYGDFDRFTSRIRIDKSLPPDTFTSTILHEVLHSIIAFNGGLDLRDIPVNQYEENYVRAIEAGLFSLLRDPRNKWFARLLLG
jgi:hypothetical protein